MILIRSISVLWLQILASYQNATLRSFSPSGTNVQSLYCQKASLLRSCSTFSALSIKINCQSSIASHPYIYTLCVNNEHHDSNIYSFLFRGRSIVLFYELKNVALHYSRSKLGISEIMVLSF